MFIKEIYIYGYGKFEQFHISDLSDLQVIYGENEAGKSTIMSFIHSILFGFPTRLQNELRYEPKQHGKYGGRITIQTKRFGEVQVERVKGKATGDVTVLLENGTRGGEELLSQIIGNLDKSTYQSIFSFNIHGLQQVHKIKGEDLSKYLFSISAVGSDQISEAKLKLDKELDRLFKPNGVKPEMNVMLSQLKSTESEMNLAKAKIATYDQLVANLSEIEEKLKQLRERNRLIDDEIVKKKEWNQIFPLVEEKRELERQLKHLGEFEFPESGILRFESLEESCSSLKTKMKVLLDKKEQLEQKVKSIPFNHQLIESRVQIQELFEYFPLYRQKKESYKNLMFQQQELKNDINHLSSSLRFEKDLEVLIDLPFTFDIKNEITKITQKRIQLIDKKRDLDQAESSLKAKLKDLKGIITQYQSQLLSEKERLKLEQMIDEHEGIKQVEREHQWISEQLQALKLKKSNKNLKLLTTFIPIFLFISVGLFLFQYQEMAIGLLLAGCLFTIFIVIDTNNRKKDAIATYTQLQQKKNELEKVLTYQSGNISHEKALLEKDDRLRSQIQIDEMKYEQLKKDLQELNQSILKWSLSFEDVNRQLKAIGSKYYLENMSEDYILEAFDRLEQLKEVYLHQQRTIHQLNLLQVELKNFESKCMEFFSKLNFSVTNIEDDFIKFKQLFSVHLERYEEVKAVQAEIKNVQEQYLDSIKELEEMERQIQYLMNQAGVKSKEEFYEVGAKFEKRLELLDRLHLIQEQLKGHSPQLLDSKEPYYEGSIFRQLENEKEEIVKEIHLLEKKRAELNHEKTVIESGGVYTNLLHKFHQEKYEFNEIAKTWATLSLASSILQKSLDKYKNERLPKVLQFASKFFTELSRQRYNHIFVDNEKDELFVTSEDGVTFSPNELSQATQEQLYISLRLALIQSLDQELPIIIDDGFVNFDHYRLNNMINLLKRIRENQQIIIFTCHKGLTDSMIGESIYMLN